MHADGNIPSDDKHVNGDNNKHDDVHDSHVHVQNNDGHDCKNGNVHDKHKRQAWAQQRQPGNNTHVDVYLFGRGQDRIHDMANTDASPVVGPVPSTAYDISPATDVGDKHQKRTW